MLNDAVAATSLNVAAMDGVTTVRALLCAARVCANGGADAIEEAKERKQRGAKKRREK